MGKRKFRFKMNGDIAPTTDKVPAFITLAYSKAEAEKLFKEWKERIAQDMNPFQISDVKLQN